MTLNDQLRKELRTGFNSLAVRIDEMNSTQEEQLSGLVGSTKGLRTVFEGVREEIFVLRKDFKEFRIEVNKSLEGIEENLKRL